MPYKITIIEKNADDIWVRILRMHGHDVNFLINPLTISDYSYRSRDVVLYHPSFNNRRVLELKRKYPHVGLIIITGDERDTETFRLQRDDDDSYYLIKPFMADELLRGIDEVVSASKAQS